MRNEVVGRERVKNTKENVNNVLPFIYDKEQDQQVQLYFTRFFNDTASANSGEAVSVNATTVLGQ